jgi:hypothetical protein
MKRILILMLVLACLGAMQPTSAWSTPLRHQSAAPPDEYNNNGDDDEPMKSGSRISAPDPNSPNRQGVVGYSTCVNHSGQLPGNSQTNQVCRTDFRTWYFFEIHICVTLRILR